MNKVLILPFLFLLIACARNSKEVNSSFQIKAIGPTSSLTTDSIPKTVSVGKVKIYIENTLSMYGYLPFQGRNGVTTEFRKTINEILRTSKTTYSKENVELFLINNTTSTSINIDNNLNKIDERILRNEYFKGNGSSDFDKLFKDILNNWDEDEVIGFIADFIYSPKNRDPVTGLDDFRGEIASAFQNATMNKPLAVNILHFESDFDGSYYDINDKELLGIKNRPYYIFIIGKEESVKEYSDEIVPQIERFKLKNEYFLSPSEVEIDNYSALTFTSNIGQFEKNTNLAGNPHVKAITVKNSLNHEANVQVAIAVDLQDIPVSPEYLMDIENYQLNDDRIEIKDIGIVKNKRIQLKSGREEVIKSGDIPSAKDASHVFLISFPSTYKGTIELSLKKNMPEWVRKVSIKEGEDDRDIKTNVLKQSQTFGFNYIVQGIYDAQRLKKLKNKYFQITLDIDQEKSGSGLGVIIGWLIGLGIIGIIIFIVIRNKQRK